MNILGGKLMESHLQQFIHNLYIKHSRSLYQRAYHLLGDKEKAEELMQEAFVIAADKVYQLQEHPNPLGWLHKTLSNLIYKELRKIHTSDFPFGDDIDLFPNYLDLTDLTHLLPVQLSEDERNILLLRYQYNYSYQEMANILGISQSACGMRLQRAKKHCRNLLKKEKII